MLFNDDGGVVLAGLCDVDMIPRARRRSTKKRSSFSFWEDSKVSVKETMGRRDGLFSLFYFIIKYY